MPTVSIFAIRASLVHFLIGTTLGALLLMHKSGLWVLARFADLLALHFHVMVSGWLVQLALGVGAWILPRVGRKPPRPHLATAGILLLNLGVVSTVLTQKLAPGLYVMSGVLFAIHLWPRIRPFGTTKESP